MAPAPAPVAISQKKRPSEVFEVRVKINVLVAPPGSSDDSSVKKVPYTDYEDQMVLDYGRILESLDEEEPLRHAIAILNDELDVLVKKRKGDAEEAAGGGAVEEVKKV